MHYASQQKKRSYAHYSDVDYLLDPSVKSDLACMKRFSSLYFVLLYVVSYLVVFTLKCVVCKQIQVAPLLVCSDNIK